MYEAEIDSILVTEEQIKKRIGELATEIVQDYQKNEPVMVDNVILISILKGAVYFTTDISQVLPIPTQLEFMILSSYGSQATSSGKVNILKDLDRDISDKHVLVIEDVIDTGTTITWLYKNLQQRNPKSLKLVSLLCKPGAANLSIPIDYAGFEIPDEFVVGYGLDYDERFRDIPYVGTLKKEVYQ